MTINERNKTYADRFVRENYQALRDKFRSMNKYIDSRCFSSLDILNETIISLYAESTVFDNYTAFERFAKRKFTEKEKRAKDELK